MKSDFETFLETFPPDYRDTVRSVWKNLPRDVQKESRLQWVFHQRPLRQVPEQVLCVRPLTRRAWMDS